MRRFTSLLLSAAMAVPGGGASATEYVFRKPIDQRPSSELCGASVGQVFQEAAPNSFAQGVQALRDRSKACADAKTREQTGAAQPDAGQPAPQDPSAAQPGAKPGALTVALTGMPAGPASVGDALSARLVVANASGAVTFSVAAGALPDGVSLGQDGGITGTLAGPGPFTATLSARDASGAVQTAGFVLQVLDAAPQAAVQAAAPGPLFPGDPYAAQAVATGGTGPFSWTISGPAWLSIDPGTGQVSGTVPDGDAAPSYVVTLTDATGRTSTAKAGIGVAQPKALAELPATVEAGQDLKGRFTTNIPSARWTLTKGPDWVKVSPDGTVSGTAPALDANADVAIEALAVSGKRQSSAAGKFGIVAPSVSLIGFPAAAMLGDAVSAQAATTLGAGVTWSLDNAPSWLSIDASGRISGTVGGAAQGVVVRAAKGALAAASRPLSISLVSPEVAVQGFPSSIRAGTNLVAALSSTIADGQWSVASVPAGFDLAAAGTQLSGVAPAVGADTDYAVTITRTGSAGKQASAKLSVTVVPGLAFSGYPKGIHVNDGDQVSVRPALVNAKGALSFALTKDGLDATPLLAACKFLGFSKLTGTISGFASSDCRLDGLVLVANDDGGDQPGAAATAVTDPFFVDLSPIGITPPAAIPSGGIEGDAFAFQFRSRMVDTVWSMPSGPAWMSVDQTGLVTGTYPETSVAQKTTFEVQGVSGTASGKSGIYALWGPGTVTVDGLMPGYVAGSLVTGLKAIGTMGQGKVFALNNQPAWLTIDPSTGAISGIVDPAKPAKGVTVTTTKNGASATSDPFDIALAAPKVTLAGSPFAVEGQGAVMMQASTNIPSPTWALADAPGWLSIDGNGLVSGTAPSVQQSLAVTGTVRATGPGTSAAYAFSGSVSPATALSLDPIQDQSVLMGVPMALAQKVTGGSGVLAWRVSQGRLPDGLSLGADGSISGIPVTPYEGQLSISARDASTGKEADTGAFGFKVSANAGGVGALAYVPDYLIQMGTPFNIAAPPIPQDAARPVTWGHGGNSTLGQQDKSTGSISGLYTYAADPIWQYFTMTDANGKEWQSNRFNVLTGSSGKSVYYNQITVYPGQSFSIHPNYRGGLGGLSYSDEGHSVCNLASLPPGVSFDPASGVLSGVASARAAGQQGNICLYVKGKDPVDGKSYAGSILANVEEPITTVQIGSGDPVPYASNVSMTVAPNSSATFTLREPYVVGGVNVLVVPSVGRRVQIAASADGTFGYSVASGSDGSLLGGFPSFNGTPSRYVRISNTSSTALTILGVAVR